MNNPAQIINDCEMSRRQVVILLIALGLNALDGFDIASISFAAPGITQDWGITRATLGFVLSMELLGMGLGSFFLGRFADHTGRKPALLICLITMTIGMFGATSSTGITDLSIWRIITGIGIGGMLATTTAIATEFSNKKRRHFFVSMMTIGYPLGIIIGGTLIQPLLKEYSWQSIFYFGGFLTLAFIPVTLVFVPESINWLSRVQPVGALEKINKSLMHFKLPTVPSLNLATPETHKVTLAQLKSSGLLNNLIFLSLTYSFHIMTFYFIIKWVPQMVADMGFAASSAGIVLTWSNVGGALGGIAFGLLTARIKVKSLTIINMLAGVVALSIFGHSPQNLAILSLLAAIAGFFINAGVVGTYNLMALAYPTHFRGFGTGISLSIGRGGAFISPVLAGLLFSYQLSIATVATIMTIGSIFAVICLILVRLQPTDNVDAY